MEQQLTEPGENGAPVTPGEGPRQMEQAHRLGQTKKFLNGPQLGIVPKAPGPHTPQGDQPLSGVTGGVELLALTLLE